MAATLPALPVEIWHQIFDEVLDDLAMQTSCNTNDFHRFIDAVGTKSELEVKARRGKLAAVCQSWRAVAESFAYRSLTVLQGTPLEPTFVPLSSVRRLRLWRYRAADFSAEDLDTWCSWIRASQGLDVLEVDMGNYYCPADALKSILACAKSVKTLRSLRLHWHSSAYLSLTDISRSYFGITTLELGRLLPSDGPLSLPNLRVLIIGIYKPLSTSWDYPKWKLPCLQFLKVVLHNGWGVTPFDLGVFQPFASHLMALHLTFPMWGQVGFQPPVLPFDLNHFPSLQDLTLCSIPLLISAPLDAHHPLRTIHVEKVPGLPLKKWKTLIKWDDWSLSNPCEPTDDTLIISPCSDLTALAIPINVIDT